MGERRRANIVVRFAVLFVIVFFVVTIIRMQSELSALKDKKAGIEQQIEKISDNIDEINMRLDTSLSDDYIRRVAREKLDFCDSDEIIFYNDLTE